ncbi:MAG: bifunctional serine/threonine-protein kinase/formylglycine-generating enzyme family protein [Myxococcota bacterium]
MPQDPPFLTPRPPRSVGSDPAESDYTLPPDASTDELDLLRSSALADRRYEDLGPLGVGGLAEVRRVHDRDLDRVVAMKLLPSEPSPSSLGRFVEEARLSAKLEHPGIVPVFDVGRRADGRLFFTMALVEGSTFSTAIHEWHVAVRAGAEARWRPLVDLFLRICDTVAYAHGRGVLHRDLKPSNVMIGAFGSVRVVDWGLAWVRGAGPAGVVGTPHYMAPEQASGDEERLGPAADVWSLGAILVEMFTALPPWGRLDREEVMKSIEAGEAPMPRPRIPAPPEPLWALALRCLRPDPRARPADAGEVADVVRSWLDGVTQRAKGRELVTAARAITPRIAGLREEIELLRAAAAEFAASVPEPAPVEHKRPGWEIEDRADRLAREIRLAEAEHLQLLRGALSIAPDLAEAHAGLADWYQARHAEAEDRGDADEAAHLEVFLREHDRAGRHAAYLEGTGRLVLAADVPGAEAELARIDVVGRRWVPQPVDRFELPVDRPLAHGRWVVTVRAPDRAPVVVPVAIDRCGRWEGAVHVPAAIGPDEVYVPAGPAWLGGDREVPSMPRRRVWVDGFAIDRFPVTNARYLVFLDDLVARGDEAAALRYVPRERSGSQSEDGPMIYGRDAAGRFVLRPDADGDEWVPDAPVLMVDWFGANAFAAWQSARDGLAWRLPTELEWEKAARGVDGRRYPWGDHADATWMCIRTSHTGPAAPPVVTAYPGDVSPYGVRGMGGGVRDWCADEGRADGPRVVDERAVPADVSDPTVPRAYRGGDWYGLAIHARCAYRAWNKPQTRTYSLGFRLARSVP